MAELDERSWIRLFLVKRPGTDDWVGAFVIDGRDYPTSEAVVAAGRQAAMELRRLGWPSQMQVTQVSATQPRSRLPTFDQWRRQRDPAGPDSATEPDPHD